MFWSRKKKNIFLLCNLKNAFTLFLKSYPNHLQQSSYDNIFKSKVENGVDSDQMAARSRSGSMVFSKKDISEFSGTRVFNSIFLYEHTELPLKLEV